MNLKDALIELSEEYDCISCDNRTTVKEVPCPECINETYSEVENERN